MAFQYRFYKALINLTFIWHPLCVLTSQSHFLPISFTLPLKRATEVQDFLSGFVFQQTDRCKIKIGRTGLHWCCWRSEGELQHGPWLTGRAALSGSWVPG